LINEFVGLRGALLEGVQIFKENSGMVSWFIGVGEVFEKLLVRYEVGEFIHVERSSSNPGLASKSCLSGKVQDGKENLLFIGLNGFIIESQI
jgi:hypothetical protein